MERSFQHHRYLGPQERRRLAQTLGLSEVQVRPLGLVSQVGLWDPGGGGAPRACLPALTLFSPQIKTWFQNRRMKHKRQLQDSQLNGSLSGAVYSPLAFCPPLLSMRSTLRLLQPWAALPGPFALAQPPGSIWDPCQGEQASLASAWASSSSQPLVCCLPDPGSQAHTQGPASSGKTWRLCVPPETGDAL